MAYTRYHRGAERNAEISEELISQLQSKLNDGTVHTVFGDWGTKFAGDMLSRYNRGQRFFSGKQASWFKKLAAAELRKVEVAADIVNVSGIIELFERAAKTLKFPKIRLQTACGNPVVLSRAGDRSRTPGWIHVTDGGPFGNNQYYGKINPEKGEWEFPRSAPAEDVQAVVFELSDDPVAVAVKYGKITGNCCFCKKGLTDDRSLAEGYGPVCAENWGLPWGNKRQNASTLEERNQLHGRPQIPADELARVEANIAAGLCPDGCCGHES